MFIIIVDSDSMKQWIRLSYNHSPSNRKVDLSLVPNSSLVCSKCLLLITCWLIWTDYVCVCGGGSGGLSAIIPKCPSLPGLYPGQFFLSRSKTSHTRPWDCGVAPPLSIVRSTVPQSSHCSLLSIIFLVWLQAVVSDEWGMLNSKQFCFLSLLENIQNLKKKTLSRVTLFGELFAHTDTHRTPQD